MPLGCRMGDSLFASRIRSTTFRDLKTRKATALEFELLAGAFTVKQIKISQSQIRGNQLQRGASLDQVRENTKILTNSDMFYSSKASEDLFQNAETNGFCEA